MRPVIGLQDGADHAERSLLDIGRRHMLQHQIEQRRHAERLRTLGSLRHPAVATGAVEDGKVQLFIGGVERGEQVEHLVDDLLRAGIGAIDLVDRDDRPEADLQRLADHELGLRHRAFGRVDQHDRAIDHVEDALHLAAEIGMAGGVDDVDAHVLPDDRGRLGEDGDAALLFQLVGIHHALGDALILAVGTGLLQQFVDQRGLAVVDVGDNGDVAQFHGKPFGTRRALDPGLLLALRDGLRSIVEFGLLIPLSMLHRKTRRR